MWYNLPHNKIPDTAFLESNVIKSDIAGTRIGEDNLDSSFVTMSGKWWSCGWVDASGRRGFIINSQEARRSEFIDCLGISIFELDVHGVHRPVLVHYEQEATGVS